MADKKISALTALTSVDTSNDTLAIVDNSASETKKVSLDDLLSPITLDKSTSRVGIGQDTPAALLHLKHANAYIQFEHSSNGLLGQIGNGGSIITGSGTDHLGISGVSGIDFGIGSAMKMSIDSSGNVKITNNDNVYLSLEHTGTGGKEWHIFNANSGSDSTLQFKNMDTGKLVMLMTEGGNVGIGTDDPSSLVEIYRQSTDRTNLSTLLTLNSDGDAPYTGFGSKITWNSEIYNTGSHADTGYLGVVMGYTYGTEADMVFATRGSSSVSEKMRILGNGNVGIGDVSPSHKLTVAGGIVETGGVLKENLLTNSGFDVWSNSTLENVGSQLVTAWTNSAYYPYVSFTIDVADPAFIDFDALTNDGSLSYSWSNNILTPGKLYRIVVSGGTFGGNLQYFTTQTSGGDNTYTINNVVADGTTVFEAGSTDARVAIFGGAAASTNVFRMTIYEVTPGCVANNNLAMDGWYKTDTADIFRQHNDGGTLTKDGSFYSLKIHSGAADNIVAWKTTTTRNDEVHIQRFAGRTVTLGAWVKTSEASHCRLTLDHSSQNNSAFHTGGGAWEWLEVTGTVGASATQFWCRIENAVDAKVAYISQPMLVFGSSIGSGNYTRPQGEVVNCDAQIPIHAGVALVAADDKTLNLESITSGKIPKGCKSITAHSLARNTSVTDDQGVAWGLNSSEWSDLRNFPVVSYFYTHAAGKIRCDANGDIYQKVTEAGATLTYVALDAIAIELR